MTACPPTQTLSPIVTGCPYSRRYVARPRRAGASRCRCGHPARVGVVADIDPAHIQDDAVEVAWNSSSDVEYAELEKGGSTCSRTGRAIEVLDERAVWRRPQMGRSG